MLKVLKYLRPYWFLLLLLLAFTSAQVWVNLQLPDYLARIINEGVIKQDQAAVLERTTPVCKRRRILPVYWSRTRTSYQVPK